MSKKVRLSILIVVSLILTFVIPMVISLIPVKEEPEIDVNALNKNFQKTLTNALEEERAKTTKEMELQFQKQLELEGETLKGFADAFTKYYKEDTREFMTSYTPNKLIWEMTFKSRDENDGRDGLLTIEDNDEGIWNSYELYHKYEFTPEKDVLIQNADIKVVREKGTKFNINNNNILSDYLGKMLGRELTDKDKNAVNVKVNLDFKSLSTLDDLKTYIYDNEQLKIDDLIIETKLSEDVDKNTETVEFIINSSRILTKEEASEE